MKSIGFDGLLNFYAGRDYACDLEFEHAFKEYVRWDNSLGNPYVAIADENLVNQIASEDMVRGVTIACGGFYGPQGRTLRLPLKDSNLNERIVTFKYQGLQVTNFEMESSALAGLATLMGHRAMTCCIVVAKRWSKEVRIGYKKSIENLIKMVLDRI